MRQCIFLKRDPGMVLELLLLMKLDNCHSQKIFVNRDSIPGVYTFIADAFFMFSIWFKTTLSYCKANFSHLLRWEVACLFVDKAPLEAMMLSLCKPLCRSGNATTRITNYLTNINSDDITFEMIKEVYPNFKLIPSFFSKGAFA